MKKWIPLTAASKPPCDSLNLFSEDASHLPVGSLLDVIAVLSIRQRLSRAVERLRDRAAIGAQLIVQQNRPAVRLSRARRDEADADRVAAFDLPGLDTKP